MNLRGILIFLMNELVLDGNDPLRDNKFFDSNEEDAFYHLFITRFLSGYK